MTYSIIYSNKFKKSLKKCFKRGLDIEKLRDVLRILEQGKTLPSEYKAHKLSGKFQGNWECHIQPDWLLFWGGMSICFFYKRCLFLCLSP